MKWFLEVEIIARDKLADCIPYKIVSIDCEAIHKRGGVIDSLRKQQTLYVGELSLMYGVLGTKVKEEWQKMDYNSKLDSIKFGELNGRTNTIYNRQDI